MDGKQLYTFEKYYHDYEDIQITRYVCKILISPMTTKSKIAIFRIKVTVKVTKSSTLVTI